MSTATPIPPLQRALPAERYISEAAFARERDDIFWCEWFCVARAETIPNAGDYVEVAIAGERILLVRDADGHIKAFYNVCRHRGSRLCGAPLDREQAPDPIERLGHFPGVIVCPYHAWSYGLDGSLRRAPHLPLHLDDARSDFSLTEVALARWGGFLFVNVRRPVGEPEEHNRDLQRQIERGAARVQRYPLDDLRRGARRVYDVAANWKVLAENYNECYHCGPVHPELVRLVPAFKDKGGMNLDWEHGVPHRPGAWTFSRTGTAPRPPFPGLNEIERTHHKGEIFYPNLWLSLAAEHVAAFTLWPLDAGRTRVACDFLFHRDEVGKTSFDPEDVVEFWDTVNRQDWRICESVQDGMGARGFRGGLMAPMEDASLDIRRYVEAHAGVGRDEPSAAGTKGDDGTGRRP